MAGYYFEVLETVEEPGAVYDGGASECIAIREVEKGKYIVVYFTPSQLELFQTSETVT
jgi:hypothetical protein